MCSLSYSWRANEEHAGCFPEHEARGILLWHPGNEMVYTAQAWHQSFEREGQSVGKVRKAQWGDVQRGAVRRRQWSRCTIVHMYRWSVKDAKEEIKDVGGV